MTLDLNERAEIIHRWIQMAIDTKTAMGNLYGFAGIMLGLCIPEVSYIAIVICNLMETCKIIRDHEFCVWEGVLTGFLPKGW